MSKDTKLLPSFVGKLGHFYVLRNEGLNNPDISIKYLVYPSTAAYNNRSATPDYMDALAALADFYHEIAICPQTLTTTWPADRDETDTGQTPARNIWTARFKQAREGQRHAA